LSRKRLTVVREFYPKQEVFKNGLKGYLENPSEVGVLAILNEKPCEALKKFSSVCVVDCKKADPTLLVKWIKAECSRDGVNIDGEAAKTLAEYCLSDMTRIENETHKLMAYVGNGGLVTVKEVNDMVAKDTEHKIYEMTDFIAKKKFDQALDVIRDMMSKGETAQRILASVYNYFRRLLHAGISGKTPAELAEGLGIKEYPAKKLIEQSHTRKKIAIVGSHLGCGTTHIGFSLVSTLNYMGFHSIYYEQRTENSLRKLYPFLSPMKEINGMICYRFFKGFPFYGPGVSIPVDTAAEFAIYDYGETIPPKDIHFDAILFVCSNGVWHWHDVFQKGEILQSLSSHLFTICNMGQKSTMHYFSKQLAQKVYFYPYESSPFGVTKNKVLFFSKLLQIKRRRRSLFFHLRNKFIPRK
jgi:hypothetical protein